MQDKNVLPISVDRPGAPDGAAGNAFDKQRRAEKASQDAKASNLAERVVANVSGGAPKALRDS